MVKQVRVDPGKKAGVRPTTVQLGEHPESMGSLAHLERLLLECEKDPDTRLPKGMSTESLARLITGMRKRQEAEAKRAREQGKRK